MNIGDPSRTVGSKSAAEGTRKSTHLESLVEASSSNERRLAQSAEFICTILSKIRGNSIPTEGTPRPERIGGTLGQLEDSICNSSDYISIIETALAELNGTI